MRKRLILALVCIATISQVVCAGNIYYVDNTRGNDNNEGTSKKTPWKSLDKLNRITFQPGDRIYLKRGEIFEGFLQLKGSGKEGQPVQISAYGEGRRPVIKAGGHECAIKLLDVDHWKIENIETTGGDKAGIFVGCTKNNLELNHIRITNCYVHDIGDTAKLDWDYSTSTGGIIVVNGSFGHEGKPVLNNSLINDVIISDCTVRYNHRWTCISISSGKKEGKRGNANFIRNCTAEFSAADGIRMNGVSNSKIEYCVMYRNGAWPNFPGPNLGGLGAWFFDSENCTIQFCEASYVQAASTDGGAFDIDYLQKNSTVQYCYGHHCSGYGVSIFGADSASPTENSVVRYNILSNNGRDSAYAYQGDFYVFTWGGGFLNGVKIHDNLSYWNPVSPAPALKFNAVFAGNNPNSFTNNVIHSDHVLLASFRSDSLKSDSNTYWVTKGNPTWERGNDKYHSISEWQESTGQDRHSMYASPEKKVMPRYKSEIPVNRFRKTQISAIAQGSKAPVFVAPDLNGKKFSLADCEGSPVLLSFISIPTALNADSIEATRAQLTFIKSMKRQYADRGLKIILVDESKASPKELLLNFIDDYELKEIALIKDNVQANLASKFSASVCPTSFLISKDGIVKEKWESVVLPAELAFAIEAELGK